MSRLTGCLAPTLFLQRDSEPLWFSVIVAPERVGRWLMDFGFGSLVDKFDERIGRRPTTVILWLAATALFIACARAIILSGILPLIEIARGLGGDSVLGILKATGIVVVVGATGGGVFTLIVRTLLVRWFERKITDIEDMAGQFQKLDERIQRQMEELENEIIRYEAETKRPYGRNPIAATILADRAESAKDSEAP